jgi:hypothetical protein
MLRLDCLIVLDGLGADWRNFGGVYREVWKTLGGPDEK